MARPMIPPSCATDESSVPMRSFIDGMVVRLLRGLNNLKVLNPDIFYMDGISPNNEVTTTIKSSQFHESLK
jgi:hypothetical protein